MADTNFRGPVNSMGPLEVDAGNTATISPLDGPSLFYQSVGFPDIRTTPFAKDGFRSGQQPGFMVIPESYAVDAFPQAASTTLLGAAQLATANSAMTLVTVATNGPAAGVASRAIGVPIIPQGTTVVTTASIALDFGFATGTTVAASSTVAVNDNTLFALGQWIVIGGAGNAASTVSLLTQVRTISTSNTTSITVSPSPATALSHAPIGGANLFGSDSLPLATQFGPSAASANAHSPYLAGGLARIANPRELSARNVSVTVGTTTATTSFTVVGFDVWGQRMSELIGPVIATNRQFTTFFGSKAFKYVMSVTPTTTAVGTASLGVGDVFGMPMRADEWEHAHIRWNGCVVPTSLGFSAAATTAPATNTTGDVRGTIQVSTNGTGTAATVATAAVSNGTARLVIIQNPGVWNTLFGTPNNTVPLFGVTNSTT